MRQIRAFIEYGKVASVLDLTPEMVNGFLATKKKEDVTSLGTLRSYVTAIKGFTKWLAEEGRCVRDPLARVKKPSPETDRRIERRMLLPEEWDALRNSILTRGTKHFRIPSPARVLLYATAIQTGLRSAELRSLTRGKLFIDQPAPFIVCKAAC